MLLEPRVTMSTTDHNSLHTDMYRYSNERQQQQQQNSVAAHLSEHYSNSSSTTLDKVSSAADAMLKLSTSLPVVYAGNTDSNHSTSDGNVSDTGSNIDQGGNRKERLFVSEPNKDDQYWIKRRKNNEAAKKSREKRRNHDKILADRVHEFKQQNDVLVRELQDMKRHYGYPVGMTFDASLAPVVHLRQHSSIVTQVSTTPPPIIVAPLSPIVPHYDHVQLAAQSPPQVSVSSPPLRCDNNSLDSVTVPLQQISHQSADHSHQSADHSHQSADYSSTAQQLPDNYSAAIPSPHMLPTVAFNGDRKRRHSATLAIDYSTHSKLQRSDTDSLVIDLTSAAGLGQQNHVKRDILKSSSYETVSNSGAGMVPSNATSIPHKLRHKLKCNKFSEERSNSEPCYYDSSAMQHSHPISALQRTTTSYSDTHTQQHSDQASPVHHSDNDYSNDELAGFNLPTTLTRVTSANHQNRCDSTVVGPNHNDLVHIAGTCSTGDCEETDCDSVRRESNKRAAQRYRHQVRQLRQLQDDKAHLLEDENDKLKSEMRHLSGEVQLLRDLIERNIHTASTQ